jgi:flavin-binding protein dodecin
VGPLRFFSVWKKALPTCPCKGAGASAVYAVKPRAVEQRPTQDDKETDMAESVYKVIELVGTSTESWEKAATVAIKRAAKTLRDLRVAEISQLDMVLKDGKVESYRAKVKVSFKYDG